MTPEQELLRAKATRALESARVNISRGDAETATNRAYYAAFYMASAYLLHLGEKPRTHKGLHLIWGKRVRALLPSNQAAFLTHAFQLRQRADYDAMSILDVRSAESLVDEAERFLAAVETLFDLV